jgi:hypothetical protein
MSLMPIKTADQLDLRDLQRHSLQQSVMELPFVRVGSSLPGWGGPCVHSTGGEQTLRCWRVKRDF